MKPAFFKKLAGFLPVMAAWGVLPALAAEPAKPREVQIVHPARTEITRFVTLPGTLRANQQATLYAKVGGYLKSVAVDKGDSVKAGQVLAEVEVPELLADLARYKAEVKVAETDAKRVLAAQSKAPDLITPQSVDDAQGKWDVAKANLERTETLLNFARLTAPFSGVITGRFLDPGAFVPAATAGSAASSAAVSSRKASIGAT